MDEPQRNQELPEGGAEPPATPPEPPIPAPTPPDENTQIERPRSSAEFVDGISLGDPNPVAPSAEAPDPEPAFPSWSEERSLSGWYPLDSLITDAPPSQPSGLEKPPTSEPTFSQWPIPPPSKGGGSMSHLDRDHSRGSSHSETPMGSQGAEEWGPDESINTLLEEGRVLFKKFLPKRKLGKGGMGEVWLVHHIELDCDRALKFIRTGSSSHADLNKRFRREARAMAKVDHPNAVLIHDAFTARGLAFIEMAYVPGQSLLEILVPGQPMELDWSARILEQLCEVLDVAHKVGIVHRDLKPANLMLLSDRAPGREFLKVLDFGIAKLLGLSEGEESITNNSPLGTYPYMSPEQCGASTTIDQRSDIYTVGIILFEFLTGFRPFHAKNVYQWFHSHINDPVPSFQSKNPNVAVPEAVENVVRRCLAKQPADRPQSATELFEEFAEAAGYFRAPSRSGSSIFARIPGSNPSTPTIKTSKPSASSPSNVVLSPEVEGDDDCTDTSIEIKPPPGNPDQPIPVESVDLSTFSDAYEWQSPETEAISPGNLPTPAPVEPKPTVMPKPEPAFDRDETEFALRAVLIEDARVIADPVVKPPEPGKKKVEPSKRGISRRKLLAGSLLGAFGIAAAVYFRRPEPALSDDSDPIDDIPEKDSTKPPTGFMLQNDSLTWNGVKYNHYDNGGKPSYLPSGYEPKPGTKQADPGWPEVIVRTSDKVEFIRIIGKEYPSGRSDWEPGDPDDAPRKVVVKSFYLQKFEVTNEEIEKYLGRPENVEIAKEFDDWQGGVAREKSDPLSKDYLRMPAVWVTWRNADAYARSPQVSGRLPTPFEWEFAASSGGESRPFVWDENLSEGDKKFVCIDLQGPRAVGLSEKDVTRQGIHDMGGNVREWCQLLPPGEQTRARGGCFLDDFSVKSGGLRQPHIDKNAKKEVGFRVLVECPSPEDLIKP